jgi:hypothetical protein
MPRTASQALYLVVWPSSPRFTLNTQLESTNLCPAGRRGPGGGGTFQVFRATSESYSFFMTASHPVACGLDNACLYDASACTIELLSRFMVVVLLIAHHRHGARSPRLNIVPWIGWILLIVGSIPRIHVHLVSAGDPRDRRLYFGVGGCCSSKVVSHEFMSTSLLADSTCSDSSRYTLTPRGGRW